MRSLALALALTLVGACSSAGTPNSAAPVGRAAEELDILEAVFRYQFDHNASGMDPDRIFLSLSEGKEGDPTKDPPPALLARFKGHTPPVAPESAAELGALGVHRRGEQGDRSILFRLTSIRWIDSDTVEVDGGYFEDGLSASGNTYRVEREKRAWVVVSDTMHWIS